MGKKDKANRTKNNARPSSSARSAELLENHAPTFFGFANVKSGAVSMLPGIPAVTDTIDGSIDVNYQIVLKKMVKKDPITKVKALKEFAEMCNQADASEVKAVLPFWPPLYCQLCCDTEHRVREAAHLAHKAVVSKVKKSLAPYLKEIIGPWFTSQYDNYPPAATAAVAAFLEAFSAAKMVEAVAFCQNEILDYVIQNLTFHTPQTLSNPKTTSPEDMESRYQRVITSSLLGYALYLEKMSPEQLSNQIDSNKRLLGSPKFWKLANNKDPLIRHSFFTSINALFQHGSILLAGDTTRASAAILNNLGENDPLVLPVVWNAILHGLVALPECWAHPNIEKQLIPKLFNILRSGGDGHANAIYPNILPLLSRIPAKIIGDQEEFHGKLFESMKSGLEATPVNRSQSESRVVAETFVECLKYTIMLHQQNLDFVTKIVKDHLISAIRSRLISVSTTQLTTKPLYYHISQLLRSWHNAGQGFEAIVNVFWAEFSANVKSLLDEQSCQDDNEASLKRQYELLSILQTPAKFVPRSGRERVTFSEKADSGTVQEPPVQISVPGFDAACLVFAKDLSLFYFKMFKISGSISYLRSAMEVAKAFDCFFVFTDTIEEISSLMEQVDKQLVVELSTHLLPHVTQKDQERLLQELSVVPDETLFYLCVGVLRCPSSIVRKWLQGSEFTEMYLHLLDLFLDGTGEMKIGEVLKQFYEVDVLLSDDATRRVIKALTAAVENRSNENIERVIQLAAAWPGVLCSIPEFDQFIVSLYQVCCQTDSCNQLLRQMLQKVKYYRAVEPYVWSSLFKAMASSKIVINNVNRYVNVITTMVDIAKDIDLTEACDADEIQEALPLLVLFMEPSQSALTSKKIVFKIAELVHEFEGEADLAYWRLKNNNATCRLEQNGDTDPLQDQDNQGSNQFFSTLAQLPLSEAIKDYQKWLILAGSLITSVVKAYPLYSRIEDLKQGRYSVTSCHEPCPDKNPSSEVRNITIQQLENLQQEEKLLSSLYSTDDYPDANLIAPIADIILNVLGGYAALKQLSKTMAFPATEGDDENILNQSALELISASTPTEFEFLRAKVQSLVASKALWQHMHCTFRDVFHSNFEIDNINVNIQTEISNGLSDGWETTAERVLIVAAAVKDHFDLLTTDQWKTIFIGTDHSLKAVLDDGIINERSIKQTGAFAALYMSLNAIFTNEEKFQKVVDSEICEMWNDIVDISFSSQLLNFWKCLGVVAPAHQPGNDFVDSISLKNPRLFVPLTVICSAVQQGFKNGKVVLEDNELLVEICANLLLSTVRPMQITAFHFFKLHITRQLVAADTEIFQSSSVDDDDDKFSQVRDCDWNLKQLKSALVSAQTVVEALLLDFKMGDTCTIQPHTDSFTYIYGYLLIWCVIAQACSQAHAALRFQYGQWLKREGHFQAFLSSVFKLMPAYIVHSEDSLPQSNFFENDQELDLKQPINCSWIEQRACFAYRMIVQWLPASVRDWCGELDHNVTNIITPVTKIHVSPLLVAWELKEVLNIGADLENMTVSTSLPTREVFTKYKVDEAVMQCVITLPVNYPLSPVKVDLNAGGNVTHGSRILLFLVHRNGSLRDALAMWKSGLDEKYGGLEECEICFSILHGPNLEIPKQACKTCRKKFHSACLYKWFSTSNKSSCPHCRNLY